MLRCLLKVFFCFFETGVRSPAEPLTLKDFKLKATLGRGAFGKVTKAKNVKRHNFPLQVFLAERIKTKTICAIKAVEKEVTIFKYVQSQITVCFQKQKTTHR